MNCPECHGNDCIQIEINLAGEETVRFYSCRHCEAKWWQKAGASVALDDVLSMAGKK